MKTFISAKMVLVALLPLILLYSCAGDGTNKTKDGDTTLFPSPEPAKKSNVTNMYRLPSPIELYTALEEADAKFNKDILNSSDKVSNYITTTSRGINFGIYASDLAYCTAFAKPQQTFLYFKAAKKLANELGLVEGFDDDIMQRIENNLYNSDSLLQITSDSYYYACLYLEEQGKSDLLGLITVGGWIESIYIAIESISKYDPESPIVELVADQQFLIENLISYLGTVSQTEHIIKVNAKLEKLKTIFNKLYGNSDVRITKAQFEEISKEVKALRNELIN